MSIKRKSEANKKVTKNNPRKKSKTLPDQNNTLCNFVIASQVSNKDRVKKIWDALNDEEKILLKDEFAQMHEDWVCLLKNELRNNYYLDIKKKLFELEKESRVLPPKDVRFRCFKVPPGEISVIIVGQDPYPNDADGLAFSSRQVKPSLRKIFDLMEWDLVSWTRPKTGCLEKWSKSVLLLNSILTVEQGKSGSHANIGWQKFTDNVIKIVGNKREVVTFLWGKYAKEKASLLRNGCVIKSGHPSPLNRNDRSFDNSRCFSLANEYLRKINKKEIDWSL
jgi:uracil-DNA glycosylase